MTVPARQLAPPRIAGRLAARGRLLRLAARAPRLLLVEGPSGYGKSAFLAALAAEAGAVGAAWAAFERGDDSARALAVIAVALFPAAPIISLGPLVARLEADGRPRTLLLDDVELASPQARAEVIGPLMAQAPDSLRIVAAGRRLDGLRLAKLRAAGDLTIIGPTELALTAAEVEEVCQGLPARTVREIAGLAGGWPVAAHTLAQRARGGARLPGWAASGLLDYLTEEVGADLAPDDADLLIRCALVDPLDAQGLAALAGQDDRAGRLARIAQRLGGLMRGDEAQGFMLAPPLRAWLEARFAELPAGERTAAAEAAGRAAAAQGRTARAVGIAVSAGRADLALDVVREAGGLTVWLSRGMDEVREILRCAGPALIERDPTLQLMAAVAHLKEGAIPEATALYARAGSAGAQDHNAAVVRVALLVYGCRRREAEDSRALRAIAEYAERTPIWLSFARSAECILELQAGRFEAAAEAAHSALAAAKPDSLAYAALFLNYHLAAIAAVQGRTRRARELLRSGRVILRRDFATDQGAETIGAVETAELDYELGRLASARARSRVLGPLLARMEGWFDIYAAAFETSARLILHDEGLAAARRYLSLNRESLRRRDLGRVADLLDLVEAMIVGEARLAGVAPGPAPRPPDALAAHAGWREREAFALARAYDAVGAGNPVAALEALDGLIADAARTGASRPTLRGQLLRAHVLDRLGRVDEADQAFETALVTGRETAFRRAFLDFAGPSSLARIRRIADEPDERGRFARLVLGQMDAPRPPEGHVGLTPREHEVLLAVEAGGSDKALGRRLGVSEHAVRFHLKNLFRKLQAHTRLEALDRARRLGLLDPP
jgi:LuxR family maltose regulon positive regulatory protein